MKFMSFNSRTECCRCYKEVSCDHNDPVFIPEGEDPFAPAHIWEAPLAREESD